MFPIRDHNPSDNTPFVTWGLIAANVIVFLLYFPQLASSPPQLMAFYNEWALIPANAAQGIDSHTLVTSMFLHGGWLHLIMNMLFLYIFGDNIEDLLGHIGYLIFYLAGGVAAAFVQMISDPSSAVPVVGASGAIAGVMGGYLLMFPRARVDILVFLVVFIRIFTLPAWIILAIWFALQLVNGAAAGTGGEGGVAYWAHAGGFVAGVILLLPAWLKRGGPDFWTQTHGTPPHAETRPTFRGVSPRDPFEDGPIRSLREDRGAMPLRGAAGAGRLSASRIPRSGRTTPPTPPPRRGPWSGGS
ncbi:MAG: rhomboid family intramembrane serine protease [Pseudomonadota bacterium]